MGVAVVFALLATLLVSGGIIVGHATYRIARANSAVYDMNRFVTGSFRQAAEGRIVPPTGDATDFRVAHFAEPVVAGSTVTWVRAGSLSDEAVDGVLTRQA